MIILSLADLQAYQIKVNYLEQLMTEIMGTLEKFPGRYPSDIIKQLDSHNMAWQRLPLYDQRAADAIDASIALALALKSAAASAPIVH